MEQFLRSILFVNLNMVVVVWGLSHSYFDTLIIASLKLRKDNILISYYIYI